MTALLKPYIHNEFLLDLVTRAAGFAVTLLAAFILWRLCFTALKRYRDSQPDNRRRGTICAILDSIIRYVIYFFIFVQALNQLFGINVMSLLAAAGVVGIAVAFGAQSVVKDVITGFFIIFEGKFEVGDIVTIDDFTGTVDSITLRCTTIKNYIGDLYIVPNGSIEKVLNRQKYPHDVSIDVEIAYESDIDTAFEVLRECGKKAHEEFPLITGDLKVLGVVSLGNHGVTIRCLVPCEGGNQYDVEREMLRRIKYAFDENGIEIPYNRIVVFDKRSKNDK